MKQMTDYQPTVPDDMEIAYFETGRQEYTKNKCVFSAGLCFGHPVDSMYLKLERGDEEPIVILFRPDEVAAILWLLGGAMWSNEMARMGSGETIGASDEA